MLVAIVAGAVIGPRLPGVDEPAIIDWRGGDTTSGRVTVSPLVDIRSRLVERSDTEVFQVQSGQPAYWRMTALDDFDGNIWRSSGSYAEVVGPLPTTSRFARTTEVLTQRFRIQSLSTLWLPAAFEPLAVESAVPVRYQPETATLIVDPDVPSADGAEYAVQSADHELHGRAAALGRDRRHPGGRRDAGPARRLQRVGAPDGRGGGGRRVHPLRAGDGPPGLLPELRGVRLRPRCRVGARR